MGELRKRGNVWWMRYYRGGQRVGPRSVARQESGDRVRSIPGIGLELRFTIDGELHYSDRFTVWAELETAAREKRGDFEERGWKA
jgi:hypothetical protein